MDSRQLTPGTLVGQVLDTKYRIERHIGSGAMGMVFRARHVRLPRSYAVKLLHRRLLSDQKLLKRFQREAELAARLSHPNVIAVVDIGEIDGNTFLVMDLGEGPTLSEVLVQAPLDPLRACRLIQQICDGLSHAHGHGLIHRDLKPDNVIVETRGGEEVARIADFGIAILREHSASDRLTTGGLVLGTPHYMAPEAASGRAFDHRVDLFALGVISYQLLTGRFPFDGNGVEVVHAYVHDKIPAMAERVPGLIVDPMLEELTLRLLAKQPDDRPADAAAAREQLDELMRILRGRPPQPMMHRPVVAPPDVARNLTPPEANALGSAKTLAIATLEQQQLGVGSRKPPR
jgi:eukaryotic-like serine/threonine-protein kinase